MTLKEETAIPDASMPAEKLRDFLRLGSGFSTEDLQAPLLIGFLRAATVAIEARISRALIARQFSYRILEWSELEMLALPMSPVNEVISVEAVDETGVSTEIPSASYWLKSDGDEGWLCSAVGGFPPVPVHGFIKVTFGAGFSNDFDGLPADLSQAVLMLAAHYYDHRSDTGLSEGCMPFGVSSLLQRYRTPRISVGVK